MLRRTAQFAVLLTLAVIVLLPGCSKQPRTVGERIRDEIIAKTVTQQGIKLDEKATPEQVVFALLQAVKDDFEAGDDRNARDEAFDRQLELCAPDHIYERSARKNFTRNRAVQRIVWHWTPILAHYIGDFPATLAEAESRMVQQTPSHAASQPDQWQNVILELADPSGDPNASVLAMFRLVREKGHWRVLQVGFVKTRRHLNADNNA